MNPLELNKMRVTSRVVLLVAVLLLILYTPDVQAAPQQTVPQQLRVAFLRGGHLWCKLGTEEREITKTGQAATPRWSHDGTWLAYTQDDEIWAYHVQQGTSYKIYHSGGDSYYWAPGQHLLAFQDQTTLNVTDLSTGRPGPFRNVITGVHKYGWLPDGSGFLVSTGADLLPEGWTNPYLYKVALGSTPEQKKVERFYTLPTPVTKGDQQLLAIGTTSFRWSDDRKWIAFLITPTASWSMDSNMLCVLSADGKRFEPLDVMLLSEEWFRWAPGANKLGYIKGSGRFTVTDKDLTVQDLPAFLTKTLTPNHFVDRDFTWQGQETLTVSRIPETQWSNDASKRPLPVLVQIRNNLKTQRQITAPPPGTGDYHPVYLEGVNRLTWVRSNRQQGDVYLAQADGTHPQVLIKGIDLSVVDFGGGRWESMIAFHGER